MVRKLIPVLLFTVGKAAGFAPSDVTSRRLDLEITNQVILPAVVDEESSVIDEAKTKLRDLPPVIQSIADERREFQMNLGKAMDTLRSDMPDILKRAPGTLEENHKRILLRRRLRLSHYFCFQTTVFITRTLA